jgi:hypothetical protein
MELSAELLLLPVCLGSIYSLVSFHLEDNFLSENPIDHHDNDWDDAEDEHEFDLGISKGFDPGYYADVSKVPRTCCECGETFSPTPSHRRRDGAGTESDLDALCPKCFCQQLVEACARADEAEQIAGRLGFTLEEFLGW